MSMSRRHGWTTFHTSHSRASHVTIDRDHRRSSNSNSAPNDRHHYLSASAAAASPMDDDHDGCSASPPRPIPSTAPAREDCWTEEATFTLIEAWGDHYVEQLELNRGNLRQKHWQEVANAVNSLHGHIKMARRSDIQCKNRMDTLKKRYKTEKSKINKASKARYTSSWPFFHRLDSLIGTSPAPALAPTPALRHKSPPSFLSSVFSFPVGRRSKRPAPVTSPSPGFNSHFRRNFSKISSLEVASEGNESETSAGNHRLRDVEVELGNAYRQLGVAIARFGEIYKRVEEEKCRKMIELEQQRMQFAKDLELQRLKLFMESQVLLKKLKGSEPPTKIGVGKKYWLGQHAMLSMLRL